MFVVGLKRNTKALEVTNGAFSHSDKEQFTFSMTIVSRRTRRRNNLRSNRGVWLGVGGVVSERNVGVACRTQRDQ